VAEETMAEARAVMLANLPEKKASMHKNRVAEAAVLSFGLASLPEKIGPRLTHDQIEQTMRDTNSVDLLKAFGLWDDWTSGKRGRQK